MKKLEGKPFALIGINTDQNVKMVKDRSKKDGVTWRSFYDASTSGPICRAWQVRGFPTIYVIDHKGVVRFMNVRGEQMDKAVETLLKEMEKEKTASN